MEEEVIENIGGQKPVVPAAASAMHPKLCQFAVFAGILILAYGWVLISLAIYCAGEELHSHILLIPFVSIYLLGQERARWAPAVDSRGSIPWAVFLILLGLVSLGAGLFSEGISLNDSFACKAFSFLCFLAAGGFYFLGSGWMKTFSFACAFLIFMVPLPDGLVALLENSLMAASAEAADLLYALSGTNYWRDAQMIRLPGITLEVARECSGIRSSWVLFITSVLASHLVLRSTWKRLLLVAVVIPLGVVRNGFRVLVIGLLCVHWGPHMVDSIVHKKGGPFFFALSLIPLFFLLWLLRHSEREGAPDDFPPDSTPPDLRVSIEPSTNTTS